MSFQFYSFQFHKNTAGWFDSNIIYTEEKAFIHYCVFTMDIRISNLGERADEDRYRLTQRASHSNNN